MLLIISAFLSLSSVSFSYAEGGEPLFSADFNSDYCGFSFDAYYDSSDYTEFLYVGDGGPNGSACVKINNIKANDARFVKQVNLTAGKKYLFSADVKLESISADSSMGANLSVYSLYGSGFTYVTEPCDWKRIDQYFTVDKSGEYTLCLRLGYFSGDTAGAAYFDNVLFTEVNEFPEGASIAKINEGETSKQPEKTQTEAEYTAKTYYDMRKISVITAVCAFIIFAIWFCYVKKAERSEGFKPFDTGYSLKLNVISVFAAAFILRLILSFTYYQCDIDVNLFKYWGDIGRTKGFSNIYKSSGNCDYPPLYLYFLTAFSYLSFGNSGVFTVLVKLMPMLCDLIIGYIVYRYAKDSGKSKARCIFLASIWLFNPVVLLDSACWGQVDSILTLFAVLTLLFIEKKQYFRAGLSFGLGVILKPQMIILLPVCGAAFLYDFINDLIFRKAREGFKRLGLVITGIITGFFVPTLPFMGMGFADCKILGQTLRLPWIFSLFAGTVDHYAYATVNCYNFWFLLGKNWVKDDEIAAGLSYHTWGMLAIVFFSLVTLAVFGIMFYRNFKGKKSRSEISKDDNSRGFLYLCGAMMYLCVSCFGPRMHERYFFPAVALLLISYVIFDDGLILGEFTALSAVGFVSVHEIMLGILCGGSVKEAGGAYEAYSDLYWPRLNTYRGIVAAVMVAVSILSAALIIKSLCERKSGK